MGACSFHSSSASIDYSPYKSVAYTFPCTSRVLLSEKTHALHLYLRNIFFPSYGRQKFKEDQRLPHPLPNRAQKPQGPVSKHTGWSIYPDDDDDDDRNEAHSLVPKMSIMSILIKAASERGGQNRLGSQTALGPFPGSLSH